MEKNIYNEIKKEQINFEKIKDYQKEIRLEIYEEMEKIKKNENLDLYLLYKKERDLFNTFKDYLSEENENLRNLISLYNELSCIEENLFNLNRKVKTIKEYLEKTK